MAALLLVAATWSGLNLASFIVGIRQPDLVAIAVNVVSFAGAVSILWISRREWHR